MDLRNAVCFAGTDAGLKERGPSMDDEQDGLLTRRRLLEAGAVATAAMALLGSDALASTKPRDVRSGTVKPPRRYSTTGYERSRFEPHAGTGVELRAPGGAAIQALLVAVEDVAFVAGLAGAQDAYTLRFRAPAATLLAEGVVGVRHKDFGTLQLHLVPGLVNGPDRDYLAAINRRIPRSHRRHRR